MVEDVKVNAYLQKNEPDENHGECFICYDLITDKVMMCPECSMIICTDCQSKLTHDRCPFCKTFATKGSYVRCQPMEKVIATLIQRNEKCEAHNMEKVFFCVTCNDSKCPECMMESHVYHERKPVKEAFREADGQIRDEMDKITPIVDEYKAL